MADEDLREIQLNGKQLVFLFMAAAVVAVVIFLCGVMVGRGVRAQRVEAVAAATDLPRDPTILVDTPSLSAAAALDGAPQTTREELSYSERLEDEAPVRETLKPSSPLSGVESPEPASEPMPVAAEPAPELQTTAPALAAGEPAGGGFVVQVAAVRERAEADAIALRLNGKGYPAFVTTPVGVARVFRVRVGKYRERREADRIAARLEKEEQFKPWITR